MQVVLFRLAGILAVALLCAALAAQSSTPKAARPGVAAAKSAPVISDEALERAIRQRFAKSAIASNGFSVSVSGGIATLRGVARVAQHKGVATRLARSAGARQVRNQIELGPAARETMQRLRQGKTGAAKSPKTARGDALQQIRGQSLGGKGRTDPAKASSPSSKIETALGPNEKIEEAATIPPGAAFSKKAEEAPKRFAVQPDLSDERSSRFRESLRRY